MNDFWGLRYGPARRIAWRRIGQAILIVFVGGTVLNLLDGPARFIGGLAYAATCLCAIGRYVIAETTAIRAAIADDRRLDA